MRDAISMNKPTVAVIGASADRRKYGNKSIRAHVRHGYVVFPVSPKGGEIEGLAVFSSIRDVPAEHLDRVSMYVPPEIGITLLDDIAAKGCDELWLNPGSESERLIEKAEQLGLRPIAACSIVDLGASPSEFPA